MLTRKLSGEPCYWTGAFKLWSPSDRETLRAPPTRPNRTKPPSFAGLGLAFRSELLTPASRIPVLGDTPGLAEKTKAWSVFEGITKVLRLSFYFVASSGSLAR